MTKKQQPKRWYMIVELTAETKRELADLAKRKDWSMRKAAKHILAEHCKREAKA